MIDGGHTNVAVIVAHPDDEVLGFGGTMALHAERGHTVSVLFLATGLASRLRAGETVSPEAIAELRADARAAGDLLGVSHIEFADFPDNQMDSVPLLHVVQRIADFVAKTGATLIYTHHMGDLNIDHGITARAVLTACRPLPGAQVTKIYAGEVLSSSEYGVPEDRFRPNTYVDISTKLDAKRDALAKYASELRYWPHPRSIKAIAMLARLRGAEVGVDAAEALVLLRNVIAKI
ncbi:MAG: PIG-L family deacetylase [Rhodospirillaceae bacterium]|nr:PIG-L family deacetylase [Rhodospirillaceae bacterium]